MITKINLQKTSEKPKNKRFPSVMTKEPIFNLPESSHLLFEYKL